MRDKFLPFSPPLVGEEEINEVVDTLRSDWITTGPKVKRFEQDFAQFVQAPDALAVSSGTAALHLSLLALGIGAGDAVITSPLTFCSTVHVIEHVGATPILCDVEPDTLNLNPDGIRQQIERAEKDLGLRVKAVLPVHLYGHPCDRNAILKIAAEYHLAVIEDAAHSLPAAYKGRPIGSLSATDSVPVLTCFSFYATKNLTTAEGGMLVGHKALLDQARRWSLHGMNRDAWNRYSSEGSWTYDVDCPGYKYNMTDIQAALGLHQLKKLPQFHARRSAIVKRYQTAFGCREEVEVPTERRDVQHAWHLYVLRLNLDRTSITRDQFIREMHDRNIGCSVHFIPVHLLRYYREKYGYTPEQFPIALREFQRMVSLPLSARMTDQDVEDVINATTSILEEHRPATSERPADVVSV
ncbi:MAG TPA: DegT/DnrJ/EryC1/StrS aminotransferase family protein [Candidatus Sulfotelmatobacter sp.]|nr:DegT/DnrJ/EryC1/StrS aminotransferase family protein [Candidatus Sulfotelmatobacter sp.]